jgi:hypothetical protein
LKLNDTHQRLVYAGGVNILGGSVLNIKERSEALLVASKEFVLEVHADKIKYMVISRDKNAGRNHSIKTPLQGRKNYKFGKNVHKSTFYS